MSENRLARKRGLFFEEFQIGHATDSVGRTITEADIVNFAGQRLRAARAVGQRCGKAGVRGLPFDFRRRGQDE